MANISTFKNDLQNVITASIKDGISSSVIASALVDTFGFSREDAIKMVMLVGTKLNLEQNPQATIKEAIEAYMK